VRPFQMSSPMALYCLLVVAMMMVRVGGQTTELPRFYNNFFQPISR
jgi:hypothetical protein